MADRPPPAPDGLVIVDKPSGWTSHDVVARMRRLAHTRKVGHAGTLDPAATGVLVLGVGAGTRLLHHLVLADKAYTATMRLGRSTLTDDAEGEVTGGRSAAAVDETAVGDALRSLTGQIVQVPSSVSAIKVDGQRAYARVRAGETPQLAGRPVTVSRLAATAFARPAEDLLDVQIDVECSSGTYVRALARDVGVGLGVGGHLTALRRTRVGPFALEQARTLDELAALDDPVTLPLAAAVAASMPVRHVDAHEARELGFGRSLEPLGHHQVHGAVDADGRVIALLCEDAGRDRPIAVFAPIS